MHHSDRGSQYASGDYQKLLAAYGTLKTESLHRKVFATKDDARREIFEYIEVFYNRQRIHSALDFVSPAEYEMGSAA